MPMKQTKHGRGYRSKRCRAEGARNSQGQNKRQDQEPNKRTWKLRRQTVMVGHKGFDAARQHTCLEEGDREL